MSSLYITGLLFTDLRDVQAHVSEWKMRISEKIINVLFFKKTERGEEFESCSPIFHCCIKATDDSILSVSLAVEVPLPLWSGTHECLARLGFGTQLQEKCNLPKAKEFMCVCMCGWSFCVLKCPRLFFSLQSSKTVWSLKWGSQEEPEGWSREREARGWF